jgi:hypothetical protein
VQLIWQHGTYTQNSNGTLTLNPFEGDGRQLVQNSCTSTSSSIAAYDQKESMTGFNIRLEMHFGASAYYLQMYDFAGVPKPWLWQTYNPPQMLPTQQLHKKVRAPVCSPGVPLLTAFFADHRLAEQPLVMRSCGVSHLDLLFSDGRASSVRTRAACSVPCVRISPPAPASTRLLPLHCASTPGLQRRVTPVGA